MKTHYEVLGLLPHAEDVVVKAAYKALAQKFHPDKNKADPAHCHDVMARLNAAYEVLGNKTKRRQYDQSLLRRAAKKAAPEQPPPPAEKPKRSTAAPQAKTHETVLDKLLHNTIDEISAIQLYEKTFKCRIIINDGWVNTYTVKSAANERVMNFAKLKSRLIEHFDLDEA